MPSHQIRVQQNNCDHFIVVIESDFGLFEKCMKCGKEKYTRPESPKFKIEEVEGY